MQVLKLFYRLILSRKYTILSFIALFLLVILSANWANKQIYHAEFTPYQDNLIIGVVNEDQGDPVTDHFLDYLADYGQLEEIESGEEELIDAIFNEKVNDSIIIPQAYGESVLEACLDPDRSFPQLEKLQGQQAEKAAYVDQLISSYIANLQVNALTLEDRDDPDQVQAMLDRQADSMGNDLDLVETEEKANLDLLLYGLGFTLMAAYTYFVIFISSYGTPALAMREETVATRERMTSISQQSKNLQFFIGCFSYFVIVWLLSTALALLIYGGDILATEIGRLLILSSFLSTFGISGIGFLIATIAPNRHFLSIFEIVLPLLVGFGSGIFVSLEYVSDTFQKVVSLTPAIWQVKLNSLILTSQSFSALQIQDIHRYLLVMLFLGLAYYAIAFVIIRYRSVRRQ